MPDELHGVPFERWNAASAITQEWEELAKRHRIEEPVFVVPAGLSRTAAGAVVREPDGRIWLVAPTNQFVGYQATFPKGTLDGKSMQATALVEVFEETGITVGDVRYLASQPWPFPASLMMGCIAEATSDDITLDPAELEDALWLTKQEVLNVQLGRNPSVKSGRQGAIAQALIAHWLAGCVD
jgi:8-oxo-dGTP pyrophosphatase MutT (NUDIX family)